MLRKRLKHLKEILSQEKSETKLPLAPPESSRPGERGQYVETLTPDSPLHTDPPMSLSTAHTTHTDLVGLQRQISGRLPTMGPHRMYSSEAPSMFKEAQNVSIGGQASFIAATNLALTSYTMPDSSTVSTGKAILLAHVASNARHTGHNPDPPKCDPETRVELLKEIQKWANHPEAKRLLCITGPAGAGKSALAQTTCETCERNNTLAASFFFSTQDPNRNKDTCLIPTIAYQIAQSLPDNAPLRTLIFMAAERDPTVFTSSLETQAETLIVKPFQESLHYTPKYSGPRVINIDGLDECKNERSQMRVLDILLSYFVRSTILPFKILLTSRPEYAVRTMVLERTGVLHNLTYHIELSADEHDATVDIQHYLRRRLRAIGDASSDPRARLPTWPAEGDIEALVRNASGQFVYASVVVRFVNERYFSPVSRLADVLAWTGPSNGQRTKVNPLQPLDQLYTSILSKATEGFSAASPEHDPLSIVTFIHKVRSPVIRAGTTGFFLPPGNDKRAIYPMGRDIRSGGGTITANVWEDLCGLQHGDASLMLSDLHSLLRVEGFRQTGQLDTYHRSFEEYLDSPDRSGPFFIDGWSRMKSILTDILRVLSHAEDADIRQALTSDQCPTHHTLAVDYCIEFLARCCRKGDHSYEEMEGYDCGSVLDRFSTALKDVDFGEGHPWGPRRAIASMIGASLARLFLTRSHFNLSPRVLKILWQLFKYLQLDQGRWRKDLEDLPLPSLRHMEHLLYISELELDEKSLGLALEA